MDLALTDYFPLLERVIDSLASPNVEARDRVYEAARTALGNQLGMMAPPFTEQEIIRERSDLSVAIANVEKKYNRHVRPREIDDCDKGGKHLPLSFSQSAAVSSSVLKENETAVANTLGRKSERGISSSTALLAANLSEAILPFFRNIALARLMPPSQFGLAISLSVVLGIVEVLTDFGLPIFAVRRDTPAPAAETMNTLQSLTLIRSAVLAAFFVVISPWVAAAFGAPEATWTYALLGPIALIRGFENLGTKEAMRDFVFWREAVALASTQIVWLVVTVLMAALTHSFDSMIWGMLAGTVAMFVMTHVLSPRRFRLGWNPVAREDATRFGRPLIINGFAVAMSMADRLLVGSLLGSVVLAMYNVGYGTAMLPRTVLTKFLTSAFLPLFVRERQQASGQGNIYDVWAWCLSIIGLLYGLVLAFIGNDIIGLVFTKQYQPSRLFMSIAGVSVCLKFLMLLPIPAAYASGNTRIVTLGSCLSASVVVPGAVALLIWHDVDIFIGVMTCSETLALAIFNKIYAVKQPFTPKLRALLLISPVILLCSLCLIIVAFPEAPSTPWISFGCLLCALSVLLYFLMVSIFKINLRLIIR